MKLKFLYTLLSLFFMAFLFMSNEDGRASDQNWGNTGAPGDQELANGNPRTCISCHGNSNTISMTTGIDILDDTGSSVATTGYVPGQTYTVRVMHDVITGSPIGYGYQIVSLFDTDNSDVNAWQNPATNVQVALAGQTGRMYAEHNGISDTNSFDVEWVAPADGSGSITFYSCGNAVNDNAMSSGDAAACSTLNIAQAVTNSTGEIEAAKMLLQPNPFSDQLTIKVQDLSRSMDINLNVYNIFGQVVSSKTLNIGQNQEVISLDLSHLSNGKYMVQLLGKDLNLTKKVIKH